MTQSLYSPYQSRKTTNWAKNFCNKGLADHLGKFHRLYIKGITGCEKIKKKA